MSDKLLQKAGDNSQQIQTGTVYITNGITEQRVREICSEVAVKVIADNSIESGEVATQRIERFVDLLLPRIQRIEKDFDSFSDPAFQVLLRKAQLTSACTERDCDYSILSELLVHRIKNKGNIKKKASIVKAVEIIDQVDDDSLCAITMYHAIRNFIPLTGKIVDGLKVLSELYEKINPSLLPENEMWMDNLSILGAITIVPFSAVPKYEEFLAKMLDGYVCIGIKKDSDEYVKAIKSLKEHCISETILLDNELLDGYVRLGVNEKRAIENLKYSSITVIDGQIQKVDYGINDEQKKCLYDIIELYSKNEKLQSIVNENFKTLINSFEPLAKTMKWWDNLSSSFRTTSIGKVIAHTNAKRIDSTLPDLD